MKFGGANLHDPTLSDGALPRFSVGLVVATAVDPTNFSGCTSSAADSGTWLAGSLVGDAAPGVGRAAVDDQRFAGDELRKRAGQIENRVGDILGLTDPT